MFVSPHLETADSYSKIEENATNLTYGLIALQNSYKLENFDTRRQNALVALAACCPKKTAPYVGLSPECTPLIVLNAGA